MREIRAFVSIAKKRDYRETTVCEVIRVTSNLGYPMKHLRRKGNQQIVFLIDSAERLVAVVTRRRRACSVKLEVTALKCPGHFVEVIQQRDLESTINRVSMGKAVMTIKAIDKCQRHLGYGKGFDIQNRKQRWENFQDTVCQ